MISRDFIFNINVLVLIVLFMISLLVFNCYVHIKEQELLLKLKTDNLKFLSYGIATKY